MRVKAHHQKAFVFTGFDQVPACVLNDLSDRLGQDQGPVGVGMAFIHPSDHAIAADVGVQHVPRNERSGVVLQQGGEQQAFFMRRKFTQPFHGVP